METIKVYYVAIAYETIMPQIIEKFSVWERACTYARIMSEEKGKEYIVLIADVNVTNENVKSE